MQRFQIFCIGASTTYGVGGSKGGWADLLKQKLHQKMFGSNPTGEKHEIYNLGVPGATIGNMVERTEVSLRTIKKIDRKSISIVQGGANNALAVERPDNFVSTTEEYRKELIDFFSVVKNLSDEVVCLGSVPMDESKTTPIIKDLERGKTAYFFNKRIEQFEKVLQETVEGLGIIFVPLFNEATSIGWVPDYQFKDGIHGNDKGHAWLCDKAWATIKDKVE